MENENEQLELGLQEPSFWELLARLGESLRKYEEQISGERNVK